QMHSVPPPEEIAPKEPHAPAPRAPKPLKPAVQDFVKTEKTATPAAPHPFTLADMNLSLLRPHANDGREVVTALSTMCLEVYYRYSSIQPSVSSVTTTNSAVP